MSTLNTPRFITVRREADLDKPEVEITLSWHEDSRCYRPSKVSLQHPFSATTSTVVKSTPIHRLSIPLLRAELEKANPELAKRPAIKRYLRGKAAAKELSEQIRHHPKRQHLEDAAAVYSLARACRDASILRTAEAMGINHRDADRWLATAKRGRLLPE